MQTSVSIYVGVSLSFIVIRHTKWLRIYSYSPNSKSDDFEILMPS